MAAGFGNVVRQVAKQCFVIVKDSKEEAGMM
jgi:hypothetical protein